MSAIERVAINGMLPDLTLIFDLDAQEGLRRATARRGKGDVADRFEKESLRVHERRRSAYLDIARKEPQRCRVIDASQGIQAVEDNVTEAVFDALAGRQVVAGRA